MTRLLVRNTAPVWRNNLLEDPFFNQAFNWVAQTNGNAPVVKANVYQDENNFYLYALVPGANAEKFEISVLENKLTIAGEFAENSYAPEGEGITALHRELPQAKATKFERKFTLPLAVDADNVTANYENSVLKLTLPKVPQTKARRISLS